MEPIITTFSSLIVLDLSWGALKQMIPCTARLLSMALHAEAFFLDQAVLSMALAPYPCGLQSETLTTPFSYFF